MVGDPIHHGIVCDESNDLHPAAAFRAEHRIDFINLADHLSPALGRDAPELVLDNPERKSRKARFLDLPRWALAYNPYYAELSISRNNAP